MLTRAHTTNSKKTKQPFKKLQTYIQTKPNETKIICFPLRLVLVSHELQVLCVHCVTVRHTTIIHMSCVLLCANKHIKTWSRRHSHRKKYFVSSQETEWVYSIAPGWTHTVQFLCYRNYTVVQKNRDSC